MHETRTEAEVIESMGCAETPEQALAFMGLDRAAFADHAPIRRLQLAILQEAIFDAISASRPAAYGCWERDAIHAWIAAPYTSEPESPDVSTFEGCCLGLGIDPDYLRRLIAAAGLIDPRRFPHHKNGTRTKVNGPRRKRAA